MSIYGKDHFYYQKFTMYVTDLVKINCNNKMQYVVEYAFLDDNKA